MSKDVESSVSESLIGLIMKHYVWLAYEDWIIRDISEVRDEIRNLLLSVRKDIGEGAYSCLQKELSWIVHSDHVVESVRLGVYRTLFFDVYRAVHGELEFHPLTSHGAIRERLDVIMYSARRLAIKKLHTGIDFAVIFEYPVGREKKIAVPLFVIGKYGEDGLREVKLREAVNTVLRDQSLKDDRVRRALEHVPEFTVVSLLRTIDDVKKRYLEDDCIIMYHQGIPVYSDLACSILHPVLRKIPEHYSTIRNNKELAELTASDWLNALVQLAVPLIYIEIVSSSNDSPQSPPDIKLIREVVSRIRGIIIYKLGLKKLEVHHFLPQVERTKRTISRIARISKEEYEKKRKVVLQTS